MKFNAIGKAVALTSAMRLVLPIPESPSLLPKASKLGRRILRTTLPSKDTLSNKPMKV